MIKAFKENEVRDTGVVNKGMFEQVKRLFNSGNPELAGELAISLIELVLTGEYSSDDFMVQLVMDNHEIIANKHIKEYDKKVEASRVAKAEKLELYEIAKMLKNGFTQEQIAKVLGITQGTVSKRIKLMRAEYPEINYSNYSNYSSNDNVNDNDNDNDNEISSCHKGTIGAVPQTPYQEQTEKEFKF